MQMGIGTHFHIAPSELNTPTPNNGSNNFLIPAPNKYLLSIFRCEAEMTGETFFIVIEVGRKDELKVFELVGSMEKDTSADFDVLRLRCEDLYGRRRLEPLTILIGNGKADTVGEQSPHVEGVSELSGPILKDVALSGLSVWLLRQLAETLPRYAVSSAFKAPRTLLIAPGTQVGLCGGRTAPALFALA